MVHYCRLNVHDKCIRVVAPSEGTGCLYLAISIYTLHCPLCPRLYYRFAKLTFLWWNNGVAKRDGSSEGEGGNAKRARVKAGERAREDQFDVNRSIVIQVNRLPHCSPRIQSIIFVLLYFIPCGIKVVERSAAAAIVCRECLRSSTPRETRSDFGIADDGKWETWESSERMRLIYLELRAYWCILNSKWGPSLSYNCVVILLNLKFMIFMISLRYLIEN